MNIAIEAIKAERARVSREQVLKIANKKLEDLEEFCTRHCILIVTPELSSHLWRFKWKNKIEIKKGTLNLF